MTALRFVIEPATVARMAAATAQIGEAVRVGMDAWVRDPQTRIALTRFSEAVSRLRKIRTVRPLERAMARQAGVVLRRQGQLFVRKLARVRDQFREDKGDNIDVLWQETSDETAGEWERVLGAGASAGLRAGATVLLADLDLDLSFKLDNPRARAYLATLAAQRVRIDAHSREVIRGIILDGFNANKTYDEIARDLTRSFRAFAVAKPQDHIRSRAHLIAVTEIGNAYEAGARVVVDDLSDGGLQMEKSWLTSRDDRVSAGCRANEAQGWIPAKSTFQSGHQQPLRFPGCRCTALYRRKGSEG